MAVKFKDYYESLGVARNATQDEIRRAYRKLARQHHPDVNKGDPKAEEKFKEINEAHEVLKDPEKRRKYDQLGANWKQGQEFTPPPGFEQFTFHFGGPGSGPSGGRGGSFQGGGFSDFFEALFGAAGGAAPNGSRGHGRRAAGPRAGFGFDDLSGFEAGPGAFSGDVESEIAVPLDKVVHGGTMAVSLAMPGEGPRRFEVRIPKGIAEGKKIRLAGQGQSGGDLFLKVKHELPPGAEASGADLVVDARVSPWEAALGAKAPVATPADGRISITVPAGTSSGRKLRLRGLGLPKAGGGRGDLLVRIQIVLPATLTDEEKELYGKLREASRFDPRA